MNILIRMLFQVPGAFVRWIFIGKQRKFHEMLPGANDRMLNGLVSLLILFIVILVFNLFNP